MAVGSRVRIKRWNAERVLAATMDRAERGMTRAVIFAEGQAKRRARVRTGRLRASITHRVERAGRVIRGFIGSNVRYARRIELGFHGTDRRGRTYNQRAYPYLRPAIAEHAREIFLLIVRG